MYPLKIKETYDPARLKELTHRFSTVYLGNYVSGDYREYVGSHLGIDIVPVHPKQDVLAPLPGKVWKVGEDGAYGKFIVLEHKGVPDPDDMTKITTLYSSFQHLSDIKVAQGETVTAGRVIGNTGDTGNSFGEHLHFQIDKVEAPFHPYWAYTGEDARREGVSFSEGVNVGLGLEKAKMYTINPLVYLDAVSAYMSQNVTSTTPQTNDTSTTTQNTQTNNTSTITSQTETQNTSTTQNTQTLAENTTQTQTFSTTQTDTQTQKEELLSVVELDKDDVLKSDLLDFINNGGSQKKKFKDIAKSDPNFQYISYLLEKGYISGFGDDTFRPKEKITRAEALKMILGVSNTKLGDDTKARFNDIPVGWQNRYINTGVDLGIISGNNKSFRPNDPVSRAEALKMVLLCFGKDPSNTTFQEYYSDIKETDWYAKYITYAVQNHIFKPKTVAFYPNVPITRYEVVDILKNISGYKEIIT